MAVEKPEENEESHSHDLPQPRFELITKIFNEVEEVFYKHDQIEQLSIFEFEILVLMLKKKIEHLGLTALFGQADQGHENSSGNPDVYK